MEVMRICEILGNRKGTAGGSNTFDRRIVSQVQEEYYPLESPCPLKIIHEEGGLFVGDTHGNKNHCKSFTLTNNLALPGNLRCKFVCR